MGDTGPDIFYEIQDEVTQTLETSYYPAFLISNLCYKMLDEAHENNVVVIDESKTESSKKMMEETTPASATVDSLAKT